MNLHRMKKIILILLLAIPVLIEAQNVMTETRQVLISPDGAYRFTFYQRALGKDNTRMYYTLTYKDRPVVEESELGIQIKNHSSPTTYNIEDYKYTYLLSKDTKSNTRIVPLLTRK